MAENSSSNNYCRLLSSDNVENRRPCLYIYYINSSGIEDYWNYTTQNIDRAGTAYINDYTGRVTIVRNDLSDASSVAPVTISHVHNSAFGGQISTVYGATGYTNTNLGKGWKLNIHQAVSVHNSNYLRWMDADGTLHYFYRPNTSTSTYTDEDGLGLTITASGTNYTMTDRYGNISYFAGGLLSYTEDANGNRITYVLNSKKQVTSVTRTLNGGTAETVATLAYNSSGYLTSITDANGKTTSFAYSSYNNLITVTHPDGTTVSYTSGSGRILTATDNESGYKVTYTYDGDRVGTVTESVGNTTGASIVVSGGSDQRIYRHSGKDRIQGNEDDIITSSVFDFYGRTVSSATTSADSKLIYGASAARYSANSGVLSTNNRLLIGASAGMRPVGNTGDYAFTNANLLVNGDMSGSEGWNGGTYVTDADFGTALRLSGRANSNSSISQTVTVNSPAEQTYVLSAWVKGNSVTLKDESRSFALKATLTYASGETEVQSSSFCADSTQWQYNVLPIVPTKEGTVVSIKAEFSFNNNPNTALFTNACLTKEVAQSYKYNSEGELISVSTPENEDQTYSYSGADLISQVTKGRGTYEYEYDDKHQVTKATNDGVSIDVTYDTKGNTTGTVLSGTGINKTISSSASYDSTGNRVVSQTDARGNTTNYAYDSGISKQTGQPTSVTDAKNVVRSSTYNENNGRITSTEIADTASLDYGYANGRLSTMTRGGFIGDDTTEQSQTYTMVYNGFGSMTGVNVGNRNLATYTYAPNNGPLAQMSYGNGASVEYDYDVLERVSKVYYNGSTEAALEYSYMGEGTLGKLTDNVNSREYNYTYDGLGRLNAMTEKYGENTVQQYSATYDMANRVVGTQYSIAPKWDGALGTARAYGYTYDADDGSLASMTAPGASFAYSYDGLKRLTQRTLAVNGSNLLLRQYGYLAGSGTNGTTLLVSSLTNKKADGSTISQFTYAYDALGNIISVSGSQSATYTYDNQSQLLTETVDGVTTTYTYDTYGNIRSKSDGTTTDTYTYGDSNWLDLLTAYNGNPITYDAIGNPTQWHDGTTFTWANGRRLASATNADTGLNASYTYDSDGLRLSKTVGGVEHKYIWQGSQLVSEAYGDTVLEFFYDESGAPYAFSYKADANTAAVTYYYLTNLQGDILGILDVNGSTVATYSYNAWGELVSTTGDLAGINPLRYRGYYYDAELGMYYLQSRYYDPALCRFINSDAYASTGQGFIGANMFAYCLNNPVMYTDSFGSDPYGLLTWTERAIIHGMIQLKCAIENGWVTEVSVKGDKGRGFLDLLDPETNEYYEVKSLKDSVRKRTTQQMEKYDIAKIQDSVVNSLKTIPLEIGASVTRGKTLVEGTLQYGVYDIYYYNESKNTALIVYTVEVNWERAYKLCSSAALAALIAMFGSAAPAAAGAVAMLA